MEKTNTAPKTFSNRNMCQTFYPTLGEIRTNSNKSFKINNSLQIKKKSIEESFPFYIYFGDIRVNSKNQGPKSPGIN